MRGSRNTEATWCIAFAIASMVMVLQAYGEEVQFVDVTRQAGIDFVYVDGSVGKKYMPEGMGSGAAFFDYDGDGHLDLYILNGAPLPGFESEKSAEDALYRNLGDGSFRNITHQVGLGHRGYGMGAATGDYDNDGDTDLYITNVGANLLYRNDGGRFADVTQRAGVGDRGWGTSTAFVDYDMDGDLDLYAANYLVFDPERHIDCWQGEVMVYCAPTAYEGQSGVLYRNDGEGFFADVTATAGLNSTEGRQLAAVFGDMDEDGDPDLFIANDKTPNFLFQNDGKGRFDEIGLLSGVAYNEEGKPESAMGADLGDYDNDGRLDIIVATYQWVANTLYHNDGDGLFSDVTFAANLGAKSLPFLGMTAAFLDYDNDGFLDIFLANGHIDYNVEDFDPSADYGQRNQLFRNQGNGTFAELIDGSGSGMKLAKVSHGAAFGDYDDDGDTDIFISDSAGELSQLLRNDAGNANHFLAIKTIGNRSNRDGIGARITLEAGDLQQVKEVRSSYGYLSSSDPRILFGLGKRERVDRLEIRWPSGSVQVLEDLAANQRLTLREGD